MPRTRKPTCDRGHLYTPENTYVSPKTGKRLCRTCYRWRKKRIYRLKQRIALLKGVT